MGVLTVTPPHRWVLAFLAEATWGRWSGCLGMWLVGGEGLAGKGGAGGLRVASGHRA